MIDKKAILQFLEKEGLEEIDEIDYKNNIAVYNFVYGFDQAELDAAREYADENYDESKGEDNWYEEYYLPYLSEISADNVNDIMDEVCTAYHLDGEFTVYELDRNMHEKSEFTMIFAEKGIKFDIEAIMDELEL